MVGFFTQLIIFMLAYEYVRWRMQAKKPLKEAVKEKWVNIDLEQWDMGLGVVWLTQLLIGNVVSFVKMCFDFSYIKLIIFSVFFLNGVLFILYMEINERLQK